MVNSPYKVKAGNMRVLSGIGVAIPCPTTCRALSQTVDCTETIHLHCVTVEAQVDSRTDLVFAIHIPTRLALFGQPSSFRQYQAAF